MKQFSLEEYIKNPDIRVITRDGRSVKIVCTDMMGTSYPILAVCRIDPTHDCSYTYTITGKFGINTDSNLDLFFALEKHEGWVNVYKDDAYYCFDGPTIFQSESEAKKHIIRGYGYVNTLRIEWEDYGRIEAL